MEPTVLFAGLAVTELDAALAWYETLLGRPPDLVPNATEAAWQLTGGGWIYVVLDPARAGQGIVTLIVAALDRLREELEGRGIVAGPIQAVGAAARKSLLTDPAGNTIALAEVAAR